MSARLLRVREAAPLLGMTEKALYSAIERGQIPVRRIGGRVRVQSIVIDRLCGVEPEAVAS